MKRLLALTLLVAAPALAAPSIQPGLWQMSSRIVSAEMPGAPPAMVDAMKRRPQNHSYCLSAKDAEANPRSLFEKTDGKCRYTKFSMSGGKLAMEAVCAGATMTSVGRYSATGYTVRGTMVMKSPQGVMRMTTDVVGKRVGDCK